MLHNLDDTIEELPVSAPQSLFVYEVHSIDNFSLVKLLATD